MKKILSVLLAGLVLVGALSACSGSEPSTEAPGEVKFGYVTWLTGAAAAWGIPNSRGMDIVADEINSGGAWWPKQGFTVGGKNYVWDVLTEDSAYLPDKAVSIVQRLVTNEDVKFMLVAGGACAAASAPIARTAGDVLFGMSAGVDKDVVNSGFPLGFKFDPPPTTLAALGLYEALVDKEGTKNVALLLPADETGQSWGSAAKPAADATGIDIVAEEYYERSTTDFTPILTRLLATNPDLIDLSFNAAGSQGVIVKQAAQLGYEGDWLLYSIRPEDLVSVAGAEAAEGCYDWLYIAEPTTEYQEWFYDQYVARYGADEWDQISMMHASVLYAITLAIEDADSLDPVKVAAALENLHYEHYTGPALFGGEHYFGIKRQALVPISVAQVVNGKGVQAFTIPAAEDY